ncbi:NEAT domain-containing protein [Cohnella sp. 56]|uniref:NEAT domain-containing protein n=1 Tax=Cohnella sp. 56 TaxID=3113722 RepID=UPI0030E789F7
MTVSMKKGLPALLFALLLSVVMIFNSAAAATNQDYRIVKADNPTQTSTADGYAVKPASVATDGVTTTLGFTTSFAYSINSLSISNDGGLTYTTYTGTTSGSVKSFTFPIYDFSTNTKAKIAVNVFGLYNMTHDIEIEWN